MKVNKKIIFGFYLLNFLPGIILTTFCLSTMSQVTYLNNLPTFNQEISKILTPYFTSSLKETFKTAFSFHALLFMIAAAFLAFRFLKNIKNWKTLIIHSLASTFIGLTFSSFSFSIAMFIGNFFFGWTLFP